MHHARRSIRVSRPGVRTSATATKPVPRPLGKWELPSQSGTDTTPSSSNVPRPNLSKWGLNAPPSDPVPQREQKTNDASQGGQRTQQGSSLNLSSNTGTGQRFDWQRFKSGSTTGAPRDREQRTSRTADFGRDAVPHSSNSFQRDRPPVSSSSQSQGWKRDPPPTTAGSSSRLDREPAPHQQSNRSQSLQSPKTAPSPDIKAQSKWGLENNRHSVFSEPKLSESVEDEDKAIPAKLPGNHAERLAYESRNANSRLTRINYKDRGSLVAKISQLRMPDEEDLAIPAQSRGRDASTMMKKAKAKKNKVQEVKRVNADVFIPSVVSIANLARLLNVKLDTLQRKMRRAGMEEQTSHDHMLSSDYSSLLAMEFGRNPVVNDEAAFDIHPPPPPVDKSSLPLRPPVVTIMGHVDHGKTTLLDTLRSTSVAKGEAGGITQHIGAFSVPVPATSGGDKRSITFLDTPGHAAFSAMRARGASVTDIVVLVVAADDGIMPQTKEVIELVQKEQDKVGLVVAVNKIDKPDVDIDRVEKMLLAANVLLERFGGDVPCVHVSGLNGEGLDQLVETINAVAEMQDVRAEQKDVVQGYVLESKMQKGLGPVATVLLLRGVMKSGIHLICGTTHAKVRSLTSPSGESVKTVLPGSAAVVSGWKELPNAGDEVLSGSETDIKRAIGNRIRKAEIEASMTDMEAINVNRKEERERREAEENDTRERKRLHASGLTPEAPEVKEERKELTIVVKADVSGSAEAVAQAIMGVGNDIAGTKIIATGVGDVSESDVMRAKAAQGLIVAFGVKVPRAMESLAAGQEVPIVSSTIIYRLLDQVKEHVIKLLPVTYETKVTGEATVLQVFEIQGKNKQKVQVAGCRVTEGVVEKGKMAQVIRNEKTVYEGKLDTLRHLKNDINEAAKGLECGMSLEGFNELRQGDLIQIVNEVERPGEL
ncbi:unnamed protein product [Somion occarium]|uniref:Translation initiation factor IF-2, mitochondrial n=1 Tax=Somion occarium TaxID=3059160 RepID=A0ABP1DEF5_9APHY